MKIYEIHEKYYNEKEILQFLNPKLDEILRKKSRIQAALKFFNIEFKTMLDIGCHVGNFLQIINQLNPKAKLLVGVDCYEPSIDICKDFIETEKIKFFLHDCGKLLFDDNSFDVVTFFEVLEHVRNLDDFLKEVNRVLTKNGVVYLTVPNATWWRNILKDILIDKYKYAKKMDNWPIYTPDQRDHVNNFNFIHIYRIFTLNGFQLEKINYYDQSNNPIFKLPYIQTLSSTMIMKLRKVSDAN